MIRKNTNIGKFKEIIVAVFDSVSLGVFRVFLRVLRPMRAKKEGKRATCVNEGRLFTPEDLLPGNVVQILNHEFLMLDMDEGTRPALHCSKKSALPTLLLVSWLSENESMINKLKRSLRR